MFEDSATHQSRRLDRLLSQPDIVPAARLRSADKIEIKKGVQDRQCHTITTIAFHAKICEW